MLNAQIRQLTARLLMPHRLTPIQKSDFTLWYWSQLHMDKIISLRYSSDSRLHVHFTWYTRNATRYKYASLIKRGNSSSNILVYMEILSLISKSTLFAFIESKIKPKWYNKSKETITKSFYVKGGRDYIHSGITDLRDKHLQILKVLKKLYFTELHSSNKRQELFHPILLQMRN